MNRIEKLSDNAFIRLSIRVYKIIDTRMTEMMGEHTPGMFDQSWDMPTAGVYYPRKVGLWRACINEGKRRGLLRVRYDVKTERVTGIGLRVLA